jgi:peptidyl-prolyl cis-trans isomerase SurA
MKISWLILSGLLACAHLSAQNQNAVVMTVGSESVTLEEFNAIFRKNNQNKKVSKAELDEYLELFRVFKLKVYEAKQLGMDTSAAFNRELNAYVKQLAQPFLRDTAVENNMVRTTYQRMLKDRKVRQILVRLPKCAPEKDTLAAYTELLKVAAKINKGTLSFADAVKAMSQDSLGKLNGGDLGWITGSPSVSWSFESAVFNTPIGKVSAPVRTSLGYHLIYVEQERPARGRVQVSHIFISGSEDAEMNAMAKAKAKEALTKAKAGESWEALVRNYSENYQNSSRAGILEPFGINEYLPVFEDAAFGLKMSGDVSEIVETPQGFHILRLEKQANIPAFKEFEPELKKLLAKSSRWRQPTESFVAGLKNEYDFKWLKKDFGFLSSSEGDFTNESLSVHSGVAIAKFKDTQLTVQSLLDYLQAERKTVQQKDACAFEQNVLNPFVESVLLSFKESQLPKENEKFRYLMNEYREGILLFSLMDEKVWKRSVRDTVGLISFHENNTDNYMWDVRSEAIVVDCKTDAVEMEARKLAEKVFSGKLSLQKFSQKLNAKAADNVLVQQGLFTKGMHSVVDLLNQKEGVGPTDRSQQKIRFAIVTKMLPPAPKKLEEARGQIISDYSGFLETQWVNELRGKYPVKVDLNVLYQLIDE